MPWQFQKRPSKDREGGKQNSKKATLFLRNNVNIPPPTQHCLKNCQTQTSLLPLISRTCHTPFLSLLSPFQLTATAFTCLAASWILSLKNPQWSFTHFLRSFILMQNSSCVSYTQELPGVNLKKSFGSHLRSIKSEFLGMELCRCCSIKSPVNSIAQRLKITFLN